MSDSIFSVHTAMALAYFDAHGSDTLYDDAELHPHVVDATALS